ncbi:MAG: hypothetical protein ACTSPI_06755 [Candidatus Heimdallarchaeaceae archaeon]
MFEELLTEPANAIILMATATTGLVEIIKKLEIDTKYIPAISLVVGIFMSWCVAGFTFSAETFLVGIIFGLGASGVYDNIQKAIEVLFK